jgi:hypothetical protein
MSSIVTGKLMKPDGNGVGIQPFSVSKADPQSRRMFGDVITSTTDSAGVFALTLNKGLYVLVFRGDKMFFRIKDDGVTYAFGEVVEPLK